MLSSPGGLYRYFLALERIPAIGVPNDEKTPNRFSEIHHLQAYDNREKDVFHALFQVAL